MDEQTAWQLVNQLLAKGLIPSKDYGDGHFIDEQDDLS